MPEIDVISLRKILELEQKKGYSDSTVFGGLDKFIRQWSAKTVEAITDRSFNAKTPEIASPGQQYASLTPKTTSEWIKQILDFATELEHGKIEKPTTIHKATVKLKNRQLKPKTLKMVASQSLDASIPLSKASSTSFAAKFGKLGVKTSSNLL